ncbi:PTS sugar transporter subunit IIA [Salisediminibacterium beveridgei]|uniref:Putative transcriptional regulator ManR n=1 Tax=Salisediminibacterium beveridgei TaxID=632773 RepID=A0A1D7QRY4_9BACI|nr:PTS sugar transporter subunit IIA [Salisediminibacterium beveridgei]AOM81770.1 putative transcriptional regulator ManR [Salisediminibacterium beveridgei]
MNARRRQIVNMILNGRTTIKYKDMETIFNVGERTLRYDLESIAELLKEHDIELVRVSGQGMWKLASNPDADSLKSLYDTMNYEERSHSAEERILLISHELIIQNDWHSLRLIAEELEVSKATVLQYMPQVEGIAEHFQLTLERGHKGFRLTGTEKHKRLALLSIMEKLEDTWDTVNPLPNLNWSALTFKDMDKITKIITKHRTEKMNVSACFRVWALFLQRTRNGAFIDHEEVDSSVAVDPAFHEMWQQLSEAFATDDLPSEKIFAYLYLLATGGIYEEPAERVKDNPAFMELVEAMSKRMGLTGFSKKQLKEIYTEWQVLRIADEHDITIMHPLREKIEELYPFILFHIQEAMEETDFLKAGWTIDRLVPLAICMAAIYEKASFENERYQIWVVCPSGLAASRLLTVSLMKHFPKIEVKRTLSISELEDIEAWEQWEKPDFIVSSVTLHDCPYPHVTVKPVMNDEEIQKVEHFIENSDRKRDSGASNHDQQSIFAVIPTSRITVFTEPPAGQLEKIIQMGVSMLEEDGLVGEAFHGDIIRTVFEKKYLYEIIPGLLFIHTDSDDVMKPGFSLVQLTEPYLVEDKLKSHAVLFMATPDKHAHIPQLQYLYQLLMNQDRVDDLLDWSRLGLMEGSE